MIAQANITSIVIGKDDDLALITETRDDLIAGMIGVFKVGSATATGVNALAAGERFQIVYKRTDGAIIESPVINYSNIDSKSAEGTPAVAVQNVLALGFNGTTGSIDVANSEDYVVHYVWDDGTKTFGRGKPTKFTAYKSSSSATQVEIADGLAANLNTNSQREKIPVIVGDAIINNAGAVITGTGDVTAVNGSKFMTAATDGDAVIVAGDYLRLGTAAGAVVTDPVYKVVSAASGAGGVIEVDRKFTGASATYTEANCDYVAAATAATADAGVLITAQAQAFDPGIRKYAQTRVEFWKVGEGFGATTVTEVTVPSKGIGTYEEVAEIEWFLRGNRGETWRVGNYPKNVTLDATSGKTYQEIVVSYKDLNARTIDREVASYGSIFIATENESASTIHTDLKTVLGIS